MTSGLNSSSSSQPTTGSPQSGGPVFLTIGKLQRTHGVKGEMIMDVHTDFPERIKPDLQVYVGQNHKQYTIASVRPNGDKLLVSFNGLIDCDQAAILRNQLVFIKTVDANLLPDGEFYHHEILGMQVIDESGTVIGTIQEIMVTGANDVYVVITEDGKELLLPAIRSVVLSIDRDTKKITVRLPEWD